MCCTCLKEPAGLPAPLVQLLAVQDDRDSDAERAPSIERNLSSCPSSSSRAGPKLGATLIHLEQGKVGALLPSSPSPRHDDLDNNGDGSRELTWGEGGHGPRVEARIQRRWLGARGCGHVGGRGRAGDHGGADGRVGKDATEQGA